MANPCSNIMKVYFKNEEPIKDANAFLKQFKDDFIYEYLYPDFGDEDINPEDDFDGNFEIQFESRWTTPTETLEEYSAKFNCTIIGISYEWGCSYVNSFDINT